MVQLALSSGEAILLIALISIPIAALAFALGARGALEQIGRGRFAIDREAPGEGRQGASASRAVREAEVRQMLEAKAYRQRARGERSLDVEAELERLLDDEARTGGPPSGDAELVAEVRQLVIAANERRARQGQDPLDVDAEVERRLRELANG